MTIDGMVIASLHRPLRVCMVTGYRPTLSGGGMEKHVYELVGGLRRRGIEVEIICEDRSFLPDAANELAHCIIGVEPDSLHATGWTALYREKTRRFADLLDPRRYDIVHCHSHYGYGVAKKLAALRDRPKLINTFHLTPLGQLERFAQLGVPEPEGAPIDRAVASMERRVARQSDLCIAVSQAVGQEVEHFYGVPSDRIQVVHNWFDPAIFQPHPRAAARRLLGLEPNALYLLYVGHFTLQRGQLMAEAMRLLSPAVKLLAIHPERDESIECEFGDRVQMVGHVAADRMALYYSAANLQCFPTVYAGFGLVLVEGMACGCPPVVFDFPAMNEIVTPSTGYLVSLPTPEAYAAGIVRALGDGDRKRDAAIERSAVFTLSDQIDRVLDLYRQLIPVYTDMGVPSGSLQ
ncbi:MAG: glycosyltransferase family 4 protein [Chloroflexota bacterium]|nr:glycosyltransferase family 4 protein [Chloroflexota bacterium]